MAFEMQVVSHAPLTGETDAARLAKTLFGMIGYTARKGPDHGISFKLFYDCFLLHPTKEWTIEELASVCGTTLPSIYRHLNKLTDLDLIEDTYVGGTADEEAPADGTNGTGNGTAPNGATKGAPKPDGKDRKRAFRLRYGDLSKAWTFCEAHFQLAIDNYRTSIDHLESLLKQERKATVVKATA